MAVPGYWQSHIASKIRTIKEKQNSSNRFSFGIITDMHIANNAKNSGYLMRELVNQTNLKHFFNNGDNVQNWIDTPKADAVAQIREMFNLFGPIKSRMLGAMANHDDNSITQSWAQTLKDPELKNELFSYNPTGAVFGPSGKYFYVDDTVNKVRYIVLDSIDIPYIQSGSGLKYAGIHIYAYRQAQINWFANTALNVPSSDWYVVVSSHIPPQGAGVNGFDHGARNADIMLAILRSFKEKKSVTMSSVASVENDFKASITKSFVGKGGNVIAWLSGHVHYDNNVEMPGGIRLVTMLNDSLSPWADAPRRTRGTITEHAIDVFTIDKVSKTAYITRIGAGSDRSFVFGVPDIPNPPPVRPPDPPPAVEPPSATNPYKGVPLAVAMDLALIDTDWKRRNAEYAGIRTIEFDDYMQPWDVLKKLTSSFETEMSFGIETRGGKVTERYVDARKFVGEFDGKETVFGKDLIGIERIVDSSNIYTAIYAIGPDREDGTRLETIVYDEDALQRWGRKKPGSDVLMHRFGIHKVESTDENMTMRRLTELGRMELNKRINSVVKYTGTAVSLEHVFGYEHEKTRVGQVQRIKDEYYNPPLYLEARVHEMTTNLITGSVDEFKLGDFVEHKKEDLEKQISALRNSLSDRLSKLIMPTITSSNGVAFKNGEGVTNLKVEVFLNAKEIDPDGTKFKYRWQVLDKDGNVLADEEYSNKTPWYASSIDEKQTIIVHVSDGKVNIPTQITLFNVFDGEAGQDGIDGEDGKNGISITTVTNYYLASASSSGVTTGTTGWTTTIQNPTSSKKYLWNYEKTTLSNGTAINTSPVIIGNYATDGSNGSSGRGITDILEYYQVSSSNSTAPTNWVTTPPVTTITNKNLWNYERITYTDGTTSDTPKRVIGTHGDTGATGDKGDDGISIVIVDVEYYLSASATSLSGGSWQTTAPTWIDGRYMWSRNKTTYSSGNASYSKPACITGQKGATGGTGGTGATGKGVSSITEEYYLSSSKTTQSGGSWVTTPPTWEYGKYIWTRSKIVYTNPPSTEYTTPIVSSEWEAVNEIDVNTTNLIITSQLAQNTNINATTGELQPQNRALATNYFIDVGSHKKITVSRKIGATNNNDGSTTFDFLRVAFYGVNSEILSVVTLNNSSNPPRTIEIPNDTKYIRVSTSREDLLTLMVNFGDFPADWSPAPEDVQKEIEDAERSAKDHADLVGESAYNDAVANAKQYADENAVMLDEAYNGVSVTNTDGFMTVLNNELVRTIQNSTVGFLIQRRETINSPWTNMFFVDTNGRVHAVDGFFSGTLEGATGSFTGLFTGEMNWDVGKGGTLTLGGVDDTFGRLVVLDNQGETIADLDASEGGFDQLYIGQLNSPSVPNYNDESYTIFVDPLNGDDNNSGLSVWANAKQTIQGAIDSIPKFNNGKILISCHYENSKNMYENVTLHGFTGSGDITIDAQTWSNYLTGVITVEGCTNRIEIKNLTINTVKTNGIEVYNSSYVYAYKIWVYGSSNGSCFIAGNGANLYLENCEGYDGLFVVNSRNLGRIVVHNYRGYGSSRGIVGQRGGEVRVSGTYPNGATSATYFDGGGNMIGTGTPNSGVKGTTPPKKQTTQWSTSSGSNYGGSYAGGWESIVRTGNWGYGQRKGLYYFGTQLSVLSGKNIDSMRVWVQRLSNGGYSKKTPIYIRTHNYTAQPTGNPTLSANYVRVDLAWGEGAWVTLPSTMVAAFKNGTAKGIGVWADSMSKTYYANMTSSCWVEATYA